MAFMADVTSFLYAFSACLLSYLQNSLQRSLQIVELPSQDEMEDEECENTNEGAWRGDRLVGQMPLRPQLHRARRQPRQSPCKGRAPDLGHHEGNEAIGTRRGPAPNNASNMPSVACYMRTNVA
jgi:hypothetical protein